MQITETRAGAVTIAPLRGRPDAEHAPHAERQSPALFDLGGLIVDMEDLRSVYSTGLRGAPKAARQAKAKGVCFGVRGLPPAVSSVPQGNGFDRTIRYFASRLGALDDA